MLDIMIKLVSISFILPFILFLLSIIFFIKYKGRGSFLLCCGLFLFSVFSLNCRQVDIFPTGKIIQNIFLSFEISDIISNIGKILSVIGLFLILKEKQK
jgi:hypothetical protein